MPYVTDTHSLVWYMTDNPKLSRQAKAIFLKVDNAQESIFIPCIVFFELLYLVEKKRITADLNSFINKVSSSSNYRVEPLCIPIIKKSKEIPRDKVADPWDRLIAATSIHLGYPLISRDESLKQIGLNIIW